MKTFDVVIVGSGPSGAMAAIKLAESGVSTAIVEKETLPRYKTCGGGMSYRARTLLGFDIDSAVEREFETVKFFMIGENLEYSVHRDMPVITMVMRDTFDALIVDKAKEKGVTLLENYKVNGLTSIDNGVLLHTQEGDIQSKFVLAADGALSSIAKMAGWKETRYLVPALECEVEVSEEDFQRLSKDIRFDINFIPGGYAWSFPKKNHLSLGVISRQRGKIDLHAYYKSYLESLGIKEIVNESRHGAQIPVSYRKDSFFKNNVLLIGDAAGFADPISAEGITNSIYSGILAAESIIEGNFDPKMVDSNYSKKINEKLIPELKTANFLAEIFYSKIWFRKLLLKKYGQKITEALCDVYLGKRSYPKDIKKTLKKLLKTIVK